VVAAFVALASVTSSDAQHQPSHAIPRVPQALIERPTVVRAGVGAVHDAVQTTSAHAQRFYDQGLAYLHSYVWIEAARSFHQALRADPDLAVAHACLNLAYVELNKPEEARQSLATARRLVERLAGARALHDRRHIEVRALQAAAEASPGDGSPLGAYRTAVGQAVVDFPGDVEFLLLQGLATSPDPFERGQGTSADAVPFFERARRQAPGHHGARHYLTHALENAGRIQAALAEAREYARLAPEVPHARHMLGHSLRRAGQIADAILEFEAADRLQRAYFSRENVPASYDWHHHHNLDLLAQSYQYVGRMAKAESLFQASFDLPSNLVTQLFNKREWPAFLRARGRHAEALAAARVLVAHPHPLVQATGHIEAGFAQAATSQLADATTSYNTALRLLRAGPEGAPMAADALLALQGELLLRTAERNKGRAMLEQVAERVRARPGPDNWAQALFTLEAMGRVARQLGDWDLADRLARHMYDHDGAYGGTHYALGLVAEHQARADAARTAFAEAVKRWSGADAAFPELADARKRLNPAR
jgi:tetratricopeptide (TPR) repeat protein